ncbi:hypothetical protein ABH09_00940 [Treponema sp. OMZ 803]|uniref:hypothetical protein n=1 Tax=Treponema sp. OMZ 803 TaxID=120682 RepID=UPI0020A54F14|nr:hypothetical protein [Treponema sp. OMZ 803]UTC53285.1 hypothetical protein ABH09_00940 [Treponema sp. OMZ 803]
MKSNCFYPQLNYPIPRTAIEAEILYQALYVQRTTLEHKFDEMSNLCTDGYYT